MSIYWNSLTKKITPYTAGEQPKDGKFIKLNTNENPYPPSPKTTEAIINAVNDKLRLYPDPSCSEFREAAAIRYGVKPEQVFAGNGSDEILAFAFGAFFETGTTAEKILFPDISYSFYPVYANLWSIPFSTVPLRDDFSININDYKINSGGVIFPNPNAPTGVLVPLDDVLQLAEFLEGQGRVLILDEAYIAFGGKSIIPYIGKYKNVLAVHTMSKGASLAGLRFGFAIGSEGLIEGLCRLRDSFNSYTVDRLALAGAVAVLKDSSYYDEINSRVALTRQRVIKELHNMGFTVLPSAANFIFIKTPNINGADFFAALRKERILVRHFNKDRIADFVRVSIGTDEQMDIFLEACGKIIK